MLQFGKKKRFSNVEGVSDNSGPRRGISFIYWTIFSKMIRKNEKTKYEPRSRLNSLRMFQHSTVKRYFHFPNARSFIVPQEGTEEMKLLAFRHERLRLSPDNPRESATARQSDEINARQNNSP